MVKKAASFVIPLFIWLATSAFSPPQQRTPGIPSGWQGLSLALLLILVLAFLLIIQAQYTPGNAARYHLDHPAHDHEPAQEVIATTHTEASNSLGQMAAENQAPKAVVLAASGDVVEEESRELSASAHVDEPAADPSAFISPAGGDDLTVIEGIGPKIASILNDAGINTYSDLAAANTGELAELLKAAGPRFALADPTSWPEQARYQAEGDQAKFDTFVSTLRGGRKVG